MLREMLRGQKAVPNMSPSVSGQNELNDKIYINQQFNGPPFKIRTLDLPLRRGRHSRVSYIPRQPTDTARLTYNML